jgi:hypothetical protein
MIIIYILKLERSGVSRKNIRIFGTYIDIEIGAWEVENVEM